MLAIEDFPHHNAHYANDHRQAVLIMMLLNGFVVFAAIITALIIVAST